MFSPLLGIFSQHGKAFPYEKENNQFMGAKWKQSIVMLLVRFQTFFWQDKHTQLSAENCFRKPILWSCQVSYVPSFLCFSFALETGYVCS